MKVEKSIKKLQIEKMLNEEKSAKEISILLKTNIAYVYKVKRDTKEILFEHKETSTI
jgi:hypothetical protein